MGNGSTQRAPSRLGPKRNRSIEIKFIANDSPSPPLNSAACILLRVRGLELIYPSIVLKLAAQLKQLGAGRGKVVKEPLLVFGIDLDPLPKLLVLENRHVCWQHHQRLRLLVLKLLGTIPLALHPRAA